MQPSSSGYSCLGEDQRLQTQNDRPWSLPSRHTKTAQWSQSSPTPLPPSRQQLTTPKASNLLGAALSYSWLASSSTERPTITTHLSCGFGLTSALKVMRKAEKLVAFASALGQVSLTPSMVTEGRLQASLEGIQDQGAHSERVRTEQI